MSHGSDDNILDDAWDSVVGGLGWLKNVLIGEFADNRPLSAVVADMLVSFIPGVVLVTSARDAIAVTLRLANYPEKRNDLMEWVLLCACLIVIALPLVMAAGGAAAAGVGAVVGGIAGSELGAALRAVMLMLIKQASKLVEVVQFLQKFIKGDILKFLRAIKFAQYEKPLMAALGNTIKQLRDIVRGMRGHLQRLSYFDAAKRAIAKLADWERKFYAVQQDAMRQVPRALAELDARLAKVLAQTAPKEAHTVAAGVKAKKPVAPPPAKQRIKDAPGKPLAMAGIAPAPGAKPKPVPAAGASKPAPKPAPGKTPPVSPKGPPKDPPKDLPDPVDPVPGGPNAKKQEVLDAAVAVDRARIARLSDEAREAELSGNHALAATKIEEARAILKPYLPKENSGGNWDEVVKRLDVSSPKDGAVFWSGTAYQAELTGHPDAARAFANKIGGVTLETTSGGRVIDRWDELNKYPWNGDKGGQPPWSADLWKSVSRKYAEGASGTVNVVQTPAKLWDPITIWHTQEKPLLLDLQEMGQIDNIYMHVVDGASGTHPLSPGYIEQLLKFDQRLKP